MSFIHEGMKLPNVVFKTRVRTNESLDNPFDWKDMTTDDYFKNKIVLFSFNCFTPTFFLLLIYLDPKNIMMNLDH